MNFICSKLSAFRNWLVPFPRINGEWKGKLVFIKDEVEKEISATVSIYQTLFYIQIKLKTEESTSNSICASFNIDKDRGLKQLFYSYLNIPKTTIRYRSKIHYGAVRLEINDDATVLEGEYWTSRGSVGKITLEKGYSWNDNFFHWRFLKRRQKK